MTKPTWEDRLRAAIAAREPLFDGRHESALRLFNGFTEGFPSLVLDLFARTLVVFDHAAEPGGDEARARRAVDLARERLPWVRAAIWKARKGETEQARRGTIVLGTCAEVDRSVRENGVRYAVALAAHRDASFYLDTRELRAWAKAALADKRVLNTFAYTGSLGVAARAAPAREVIHLDKSREALNVAKDSYTLNGFPIRRPDFVAADFFEQTARWKRAGELFDCVIVDPPFFSSTAAGRVDLEREGNRIVNKARPLVGDGGVLVVVNNALYLPGQTWKATLDAMCEDGYLAIETIVPVPDDVRGMVRVGEPAWPADPSPFSHPTKIAILRVRRKDGRRA
jgi:23S rRNA (cytosine1962-C5)-methyltransferase